MKTEIIIEIINGYKEAFIFAESARDHEGNFIDDMTDYEFSDQAHQRIIRDVAAFCDANDAAISEAMSDGATANRLTNAAKFMPNVSAYIGEDNLIYIE